MIIKKLSEDCVKVLMEREDIEKYHIPYDKLSEQDEETVEFIYRLLFLIYDRTGVSFLENAVTVEAMSGVGESYYITVSRSEGISEGLFLTKDTDTEETLLFAIENREILKNIYLLIKEATLHPTRQLLYRFMGKFYLVLDFPVKDCDKGAFSVFLQKMEEFAFRLKAASEKEGYLCERGELISTRPLF